MKQKEVFNKIGGIIQELSDQYEYLQTVIDDLNDLELELFVSNAHFLTDHIEILCKLNLQKNNIKKPAAEKQESLREQKFFEPVVQQMKHGNGTTETKPAKDIKPVEVPENIAPEEQPAPQIDLSAETPIDSYSFIREEPQPVRHELILEEAQNFDEEPANPENEITEDAKKEKADITAETEEPVVTTENEPVNTVETAEPEPANIIEAEEAEPVTEIKEEEIKAEEPVKSSGDDKLTINQKISSQQADKAKAEQNIKPISDIKLAITLNDKLLYVKDLFNGYNLAYSEAIEILNRFNTFEEASRFLKTNYVTKNNWDGKPATTEKFYALLKRRYA
jgi:hypothetical protein